MADVFSGSIYVQKRNIWPRLMSLKTEDVWKLRLCDCSGGVLSYKRPAPKLGGDALVSIVLIGATVGGTGVGSLAIAGKWPMPPPTSHMLAVKAANGDEWCLCAPDAASLKTWTSVLTLHAGKKGSAGEVAVPEVVEKTATATSSSASSTGVTRPQGTAAAGASVSPPLANAPAPRRRSLSLKKKGASAGVGGGGVAAASVAQVLASEEGGFHDTVGPLVVPTRFLVGCDNDPVEAQRRWAVTHAWRRDNALDVLLAKPPGRHHLAQLKALYEHFYHRRGKNGTVVYYDVISPKNQGKLLEILPWNDLIMYYMYVSEYCYLALSPSDPGGRQITVYDLTHVGYGDLFGSTIKMAKEVIALFSAHYPERADKVFIVNAPGFFAFLWRIVKPILDPRTAAKVSISGKDRTDLLEYIDAANVPLRYGGTDETPVGQAPEELEYVAYTKRCAELDLEEEMSGKGGGGGEKERNGNGGSPAAEGGAGTHAPARAALPVLPRAPRHILAHVRKQQNGGSNHQQPPSRVVVVEKEEGASAKVSSSSPARHLFPTVPNGEHGRDLDLVSLVNQKQNKASSSVSPLLPSAPNNISLKLSSRAAAKPQRLQQQTHHRAWSPLLCGVAALFGALFMHVVLGL